MISTFHEVDKCCEICGKKLILKNNRDILRKRFCSKICRRAETGKLARMRAEEKRIVRFCQTCDKMFSTCKSLDGKFCSISCYKKRPIKIWIERGYVKMPDRDTGRSRVSQHTLIAEKILGRKFKKGEIVHHVNLNKSDNRNRNLLICDFKYHAWLHSQYQLRFAELYLR